MIDANSIHAYCVWRLDRIINNNDTLIYIDVVATDIS